MLKKLFGWLFPKPAAKSPSLFPEGYTLNEWHANEHLPSQFKKVLDETVVQYALSVLYNHIPSGYPLRGEAISETQAAVELGRMNGYIECLHLLKALGKSPTTAAQVEQTYGSDNPDTWQ